MKSYYFIPIFLFVLIACKKSSLEKVPECIQKEIGEFNKSESTCSNSAKVDEYKFQGNIVFVFNPGLCGADLSSAVYNSNCEYLGFLGGFIGNDTINGDSFSDHATYQETIWHN